MSATRLLMLGAIRQAGRAHGYQVRADLLWWQTDDWACTKWGSVYHALKRLADQEMLAATHIERGTHGQPRTEYEITDKGDTEFFRLLRSALRHPEHRPDMLAAGVAFLPALSRTEAIGLLKERLAELEAQRAEIQRYVEGNARFPDQGPQPAHVPELYHLWAHSTDSAIGWTRGLVERLEAGAYTMAGEPAGT